MVGADGQRGEDRQVVETESRDREIQRSVLKGLVSSGHKQLIVCQSPVHSDDAAFFSFLSFSFLSRVCLLLAANSQLTSHL